MADNLEKTGIILQAQGFNDYVKKLSDIDKKQREVFDKEFKGLGLSYSKVISASKAYERQLASELKALQRNEREQANIAAQAERAAASKSRGFGGAVGGAAGQLLGGFLTAQTAATAVEFAKQAAQFQSQQAGLANLARSYGTASSDIINAMQRASNGVLSSADIIQAANKALLLDVAKTPEQFERVTSAAITLGRAMGLTATESIDQFTTALGRRSLLILDNFGISAKQVNAEMERLARVQFGQAVDQLDEAQKNALFMSAALSVAERAAGNIGPEAGAAAEQFERMNATLENSKLLLGEVLRPTAASGAGGLTEAIDTFNKGLILASAYIAGIDAQLKAIELPDLRSIIGGLSGGGGLAQAGISLGKALVEGTGPFAKDAGDNAANVFQEAFDARFKELSGTIGQTFPDAADNATQATQDNTAALEDNSEAVQKNIEARQKLGRDAEKIALQFERAQEDAARKQARAQAKLDEQQAKARDKLLIRQQKELDKLEADAAKDRLKLQEDAGKREAKARQDAAKREQDDQRKLLLQLKQAQERFDLDRLQSRRRFALSDERLRAEGDILGLKQLREDFALQEKEAEENFDLQNKQAKDSAAEQTREQVQALDEQINEIRESLAEQNAEFETNLAERRQALLTSFDEEEAALRESQQEQRDELQRNYQEQIEDLQLSRQRQLEDLGRSFLEQEGITKDGAERVANELEKAFGEEGIADQIMTGFTERQSSNFQQLFDNLEKELTGFGEGASNATANTPAGTAPSRTGRQSLDTGGFVRGASGAPVDITARGGEMVLNQGQQMTVARMLAPVVQSQTVNHRFSGSVPVNFSGADGASAGSVDAAVNAVTEMFEEAITRFARTR